MNPPITQRLKPWPQAVMLGLWMMLAAGCATRSKPAPLMAETKQAEVTRKEINYQLFDFVARYSRRIEFAADQIAEATSDPKVQYQSLLWKLHAVPAAFLAIVHQDPVAILVDLWALCAQQTAYFASGAGKDLFGDQQGVAVTTVRQLETEVMAMATDLLRPKSVVAAREGIARWTEEHPLENHQFARTSIISIMARIFPDGTAGPFQTLNSMPAEIADLKGRLTLQMDQLPRQARWQAELMATDLAGRLVAQQLTSAFQWVKTEREAVLADIERQRLATLEAIRQERRIILQGIEEMRKATLAELRAQPLALQIDVEKTGLALVDRVFARLMVLFAVGYGVVLVTILLAYAFLRRQQRPQARDWTKVQYRSIRQKGKEP
ncbi:MAG: hypothetical protein HY282_16075 [Nitrospirae bacterium]|nr:hypothetical protein [Candidatus Manganitrophaceae bacterium]